jgi:hypothetical protein
MSILLQSWRVWIVFADVIDEMDESQETGAVQYRWKEVLVDSLVD